MFKQNSIVLALLIILLPLDALANPLFLGQTVELTYYAPSTSDVYRGPWTAVVGDGVEFSYVLGCFSGASCVDVDLSDTNILVTMHYVNEPGNFTPYPFNGIRIYDLNGMIPDFTSVSINPATNMAGFGAPRLTFDSNNIWLNFESLIGTSTTIVSLDVVGATDFPVPEPATALLAFLGAAALLGLRRKERE
jgi:hypothetical protein